MLESEEQFRRTLHLELYATRAEHFIGRSDIELHIGDVEFRFVIMLDFSDFLLPVFMHDLSLGVLVIFLLREQVRRSDVRITHARANDVRTCLRLVLHGGGDIVRVVQVKG